MIKSIPWLALGIGLLVSLLLFVFSPLNTGSKLTMPLLLALFMSEFGFIITAIGAGISIRDVIKQANKIRPAGLLVGNLLLVMYFINMGLVFWAASGGLGN